MIAEHPEETSSTAVKAGPAPYNSRLQKGGALIDDMRALVRAWPPPVEGEAGLAGYIHGVLAKETATRSADILRRSFAPRFIHGFPPDAWQLLRPLEDAGFALNALRPLYYWVTARSDRLMYEYVTGFLTGGPSNQPRIDSEHTAIWITATVRPVGLVWTEKVTIKVARGLMAALRDFGVLEGSSKKRQASLYLPIPIFALIAFVLNLHGSHGSALMDHPDWGLFLLTNRQVRERMFLEAAQSSLLTYHAAGSLVGVEFPVKTLEEYVRVVIERSHRAT